MQQEAEGNEAQGMNEEFGTILDFQEPSATFHIAGEKSGWIKLRLLPMAERKEMIKACTKAETKFVKVPGFARPHKDVSEEFDADKFNQLFWEYALEGWGDFFDRNKVAIPFAAENIPMMMGVRRFAIFANESYGLLEKAAEEGKEAEAGN